MTHTEIAEKLDIPLGTVKSRSHRAHHTSPNSCATSARPQLTGEKRRPMTVCSLSLDSIVTEMAG